MSKYPCATTNATPRCSSVNKSCIVKSKRTTSEAKKNEINKFENKKTTDYKIPGSASLSLTINIKQPPTSGTNCLNKSNLLSATSNSKNLNKRKENSKNLAVTTCNGSQGQVGGKQNIVDLIYEKMVMKKLNNFANKQENSSTALASPAIANIATAPAQTKVNQVKEFKESGYKPKKEAAKNKPNTQMPAKKSESSEQHDNELYLNSDKVFDSKQAEIDLKRMSFFDNRSPKNDSQYLTTYNYDSNRILSSVIQKKPSEKRGLFKANYKDKFKDFISKFRSLSRDPRSNKAKAIPAENHAALVNIIDNFNQKYDNFLSSTNQDNVFRVLNSNQINDEGRNPRNRLSCSVSNGKFLNSRKRSNFNSVNLDSSEKDMDDPDEFQHDPSSRIDKPKRRAFGSRKGITIDLDNHRGYEEDLDYQGQGGKLMKTQRKYNLLEVQRKKSNFHKVSISHSSNDRTQSIGKTRNNNIKSRKDVIFRDVSAIYRSDIDYESSFDEESNSPIKSPKKIISPKRNIKGSFINTSEINLNIDDGDYNSDYGATKQNSAVPKGKINIITINPCQEPQTCKAKPTKLNEEKNIQTQSSNKIIFSHHNQGLKNQPIATVNNTERVNTEKKSKIKQSPMLSPKNQASKKQNQSLSSTYKTEKDKEILGNTIKLY